MDNFRVDLHRARGTALGCPTGRMRRPARREWGCTTTSVTSSLAFQWHPWDPLLDMSKEEHLWKMHKKNGWVGLECSPKYTTITNHVLGDVFFSSGMNIHKSPAIWGSGDARFPGLRRPHRKSQVDRGATLGAKMCFDDLWWRIGSKNWEPYFSGLWDIGWILGLNFLSFFLMVWFLAFFWMFSSFIDAFSREPALVLSSDHKFGDCVRRTSMTSGLGSRVQRLSLLQIAIPISSQQGGTWAA